MFLRGFRNIYSFFYRVFVLFFLLIVIMFIIIVIIIIVIITIGIIIIPAVWAEFWGRDENNRTVTDTQSNDAITGVSNNCSEYFVKRLGVVAVVSARDGTPQRYRR